MRLTKLFGVLFVALLLSMMAMPAAAASDGCNLFPVTLTSTGSGDEFEGTAVFEEGEVISWVFDLGNSSNSNDWDVQIDLNGTVEIFDDDDYSASGIITGSVELPQDGVYEFYFYTDSDNTVNTTATITCDGEPDDLGPFAFDGRINDRDAAAPAVVYPREGGTAIEVLDVNGDRLLYVTASEIGAVGASPAQNTVIASGNGVVVSRASNGDFIVTAPQYNGKTYVLVFDVIASGIPYTSYEIE